MQYQNHVVTLFARRVNDSILVRCIIQSSPLTFSSFTYKLSLINDKSLPESRSVHVPSLKGVPIVHITTKRVAL